MSENYSTMTGLSPPSTISKHVCFYTGPCRVFPQGRLGPSKHSWRNGTDASPLRLNWTRDNAGLKITNVMTAPQNHRRLRYARGSCEQRQGCCLLPTAAVAPAPLLIPCHEPIITTGEAPSCSFQLTKPFCPARLPHTRVCLWIRTDFLHDRNGPD